MDGESKKRCDENLLVAIKAGDDSAFKHLFVKYYQSLCNFAYTYVSCTHHSEEIVQDVFEHFWEIKDQIGPPDNIRAYLFTSVRNKALDKISKKNTEEKYIRKYAIHRRKRTFQQGKTEGKSAFKKEIQKGISNLPNKARRIYLLSRKEGLTYKEIADFLDLSIKTVESQMARSLKKLRSHLEEFKKTE